MNEDSFSLGTTDAATGVDEEEKQLEKARKMLEAREAEVEEMAQTVDRLRDEKMDLEERLREVLLERERRLGEEEEADEDGGRSGRGDSEVREELAMLQARLESHQAEIEEMAEAERKIRAEKAELERR